MLSDAAAREQQRLREQLVAAYRTLEGEAERQRASAREMKELKAHFALTRRTAARAVLRALREATGLRTLTLRIALGRWADAARFLEPALDSSAAHVAQLHTRLHELQAGLGEARDAVQTARTELAQEHGAALAAHQLVAQGERVIAQSEEERQRLTDELRESELRAASLEVRLLAAEAMLSAAREHEARGAHALSAPTPRAHALRDYTNRANAIGAALALPPDALSEHNADAKSRQALQAQEQDDALTAVVPLLTMNRGLASTVQP